MTVVYIFGSRLAERFPHVREVRCDISYERIDEPESSPLRHVQSTHVIRQETMLRSIWVRCHRRACAVSESIGADMLPIIVNAIEQRRSEDVGEVECSGSEDCTTRIRYHIACEFLPDATGA